MPDEMPPRILKQEFEQKDADAAHAVTTRGDLSPAAAVESLPVLEAFQTFLEEERRQARRRLAAICLAFLVLLVAVSASGVFLGWSYLVDFREDFASVETRLSNFRDDSSAVNVAVHEALTEVSKETKALKERFETGNDSLAAAQKDIDAIRSGFGSDVDSVRGVLDMLQAENTALRESIGDLRGELPQLTSNLVEFAVEREMLRSEPTQATPPLMPGQPTYLAVRITPDGSATPATWRFPIPE